jgi:hypothetical protein
MSIYITTCYCHYRVYHIIFCLFSSRLVRNMKLAGNANKIAVVVGTITNDLRLEKSAF